MVQKPLSQSVDTHASETSQMTWNKQPSLSTYSFISAIKNNQPIKTKPLHPTTCELRHFTYVRNWNLIKSGVLVMLPSLIHLLHSVLWCYSIKITWKIFRYQKQISYEFTKPLYFRVGVSAGIVLWKPAVRSVRVKRVQFLPGWKSC